MSHVILNENTFSLTQIPLLEDLRAFEKLWPCASLLFTRIRLSVFSCLTFRIALAYANECVEMRLVRLEPYLIRKPGNYKDQDVCPFCFMLILRRCVFVCAGS